MKYPARIPGALVCLALLTSPAFGYSLLSHEQIVDIEWKEHIQPLLLKRFPAATQAQLHRAHAYAYGGCLIQDIGYYPFGSKFFSDLTHYVRSGDFVANLVRESADLDQYAFALGALAHYASDNAAHPYINRAVALSFPKLRRKYGDSITYAEDPRAHIRTEFGFDMVQVAKNRYTSDTYHDFIGFEVSKPVLERALYRTYGLHLDDVFGSVDLAFGTFRRTVSQIIPEVTHVALVERRAEIVKEVPNFNAHKFLYNLSRSEYEKEWGKDYRHPTFGARVLAFLLKATPKIGPFKALAFKIPTPQTEDIYFKSVNKTVETYEKLLHQVERGHLSLANLDCDTGKPAAADEYILSDRAYAKLLDEHSKRNLGRMTPELRQDILAYYSRAYYPPSNSRKDRKAWCNTLAELKMLEVREPALVPTGR